MYAIKYLRKKNIPYILSVDGGVIREESVKKYKLKRYLVMGASKYMCPSQKSADYLFHYGAKRSNIYFYPFTSVKENDVYMANEQEKMQLKKSLLIPEQKVILAVGQFIKRKGFDLLIKSASALGEEYGVYIIGGKPTEEYINLRKEYNANNVHFLPFKNKKQLANYFKMADLFVLPTREDIWGLVINEAMAYSLGVITTDNCVAGLELIKHGENGYIIPTENVEEITNSILQAEKVGFSKLGDKSLEIILENGTIEKEAQVILEILG
jgi:glycosyltransferase involved in cell wall biosynthesis